MSSKIRNRITAIGITVGLIATSIPTELFADEIISEEDDIISSNSIVIEEGLEIDQRSSVVSDTSILEDTALVLEGEVYSLEAITEDDTSDFIVPEETETISEIDNVFLEESEAISELEESIDIDITEELLETEMEMEMPFLAAEGETAGSCGDNAEWEYAAGVLKITGTGTVDIEDESPWYSFSSDITDVIISEGITRIGDYSFNELTALKEVTLPSTLLAIGGYAFCECTSLKHISLPENLTKIEMCAFLYCGLTEIVVPERVTFIGASAFSRCNALKTASLPSRNVEIRESIFAYCGNLQEVELPEDLNYLPLETFFGCRELNELVLPEGITEIEKRCFMGCYSLDIKLPESVTIIRGQAFDGCKSLSALSLPNITKIESHTFSGCTSLKSIDLGDKRIRIDVGVFEDCSSLESVSFHGTIEGLYEEAFQNCTSLKSIDFLEGTGITTIESSTFKNCDSLIKVIIPEGVSSIKSGAFGDCDNLVEIEIPKSVTYLSGFNNTNIQTVTIPGNVTDIGYGAFKESSLKTVYFSQGEQNLKIEYEAFEECTELTEVEFSGRLTSMDHYCFSNCSNLKEIELSDCLSTMGVGCFSGTGIKEIIFPDGLLSIGRSCFKGCTRLDTVELPDQLSCIEADCFAGCTSLVAVDIPNQVTSIEYGAFYKTGLIEITLPESITEIEDAMIYEREVDEDGRWHMTSGLGKGAFQDCTSLQTVNLPETLYFVGTDAFRGCTSLRNIDLPDSIEEIGDRAFENTGIQSITYPYELAVLGDTQCDAKAVFFRGDYPQIVSYELGISDGKKVESSYLPLGEHFRRGYYPRTNETWPERYKEYDQWFYWNPFTGEAEEAVSISVGSANGGIGVPIKIETTVSVTREGYGTPESPTFIVKDKSGYLAIGTIFGEVEGPENLGKGNYKYTASVTMPQAGDYEVVVSCEGSSGTGALKVYEPGLYFENDEEYSEINETKKIRAFYVAAGENAKEPNLTWTAFSKDLGTTVKPSETNISDPDSNIYICDAQFSFPGKGKWTVTVTDSVANVSDSVEVIVIPHINIIAATYGQDGELDLDGNGDGRMQDGAVIQTYTSNTGHPDTERNHLTVEYLIQTDGPKPVLDINGTANDQLHVQATAYDDYTANSERTSGMVIESWEIEKLKDGTFESYQGKTFEGTAYKISIRVHFSAPCSGNYNITLSMGECEGAVSSIHVMDAYILDYDDTWISGRYINTTENLESTFGQLEIKHYRKYISSRASAKKFLEMNNGSNGLCFGLVTSAMAIASGEPAVTEYGDVSGQKSLGDLDPNAKDANGLSIKEYIKYLHAAQCEYQVKAGNEEEFDTPPYEDFSNTDIVIRQRNNNRGNLDGLCWAMFESGRSMEYAIMGIGHPEYVEIALKNEEGRHSVLALAYQKLGDTKLIYVYDPNASSATWNSQVETIKITGDTWHYECGGHVYDSSLPDNWISYSRIGQSKLDHWYKKITGDTIYDTENNLMVLRQKKRYPFTGISSNAVEINSTEGISTSTRESFYWVSSDEEIRLKNGNAENVIELSGGDYILKATVPPNATVTLKNDPDTGEI